MKGLIVRLILLFISEVLSFKKVKKNRRAPALDFYKYLNQSLSIVILFFGFTLFWFTELNYETIKLCRHAS